MYSERWRAKKVSSCQTQTHGHARKYRSIRTPHKQTHVQHYKRPIPTRGHVGGGLYHMSALAPRGVRLALTLSAHQRYAAKSHKIRTGCHRWALRPPPLFALCLVNQSASASIKNSLTDRETDRDRKTEKDTHIMYINNLHGADGHPKRTQRCPIQAANGKTMRTVWRTAREQDVPVRNDLERRSPPIPNCKPYSQRLRTQTHTHTPEPSDTLVCMICPKPSHHHLKIPVYKNTHTQPPVRRTWQTHQQKMISFEQQLVTLTRAHTGRQNSNGLWLPGGGTARL